MGRFTKRIFAGLAAACLTVGTASADFLLADFDDGSNESKMAGRYYYLYVNDDNDANLMSSSGGPDPEYNAVVSYKAIDGSGYDSPHALVIGVSTLPAHDPDVEPDGYYPGFGAGISITSADDVGYGADFKNVTAVSFYLKGTPGAKVKFKVETIENAPNNAKGKGCGNTADPETNANAYGIFLPVTDSWTKHTVSLTPIVQISGTEMSPITTANAGPQKAGELAQFGWYGCRFTFKPENVSKIAWSLDSDQEDNQSLTNGAAEVAIDNVTLVGSFTYSRPDECAGCVSTTFGAPTPNRKLSDFEGEDSDNMVVGCDGDIIKGDADPLRNSRGYYWFSYNDGEAGGNSSTPGLVSHSYCDKESMIMDVTDKGREGGKAAYINFEIGSMFQNDKGANISGFAGIGTNLYDDEVGAAFLNASAFTGIYFEYKTEGTDAVDVELTDSFDAIGRAADADGEVFYTRIEGTGGQWKAAKIDFTKLVLPMWVATSGERRKNPPNDKLDLSKLAQLKFKITSGDGNIAIDNVYFYGSDGGTEWSSVKMLGARSGVKASGLRATYSRGVVGVNWTPVAPVASGKVQLINTKGRVVASAPIAKNAGSRVTAQFSKNIPTGMYFVRVNAKDLNGKRVVQQAAISVVK